MKKIIFLLPSFENVSPVRAAFALIKSLAKCYEIIVVSIDNEIKHKQTIQINLEELNLNVLFLNNHGINNIFKAKKIFQDIVNEIEPDFIISYLMRADIITALIDTKAIKISSIRNMIEHECKISHGKFIGSIFGFLHKYSLKKFDKIIVISDDMMDYFLQNKFDSNRLVLIHNSLDEDDVNAKLEESIVYPFNSDYPTIVTVSSLIKRKNISLLLKVAIKLLKEGNKLNVLIIGDGKEKERLQTMVKGFGFEKYFFFTGHISNPIPYIKQSDIFVMTSLSEGVPRSLMEALYLGKVCIVSDIAGNRELIKDGKNGFLFQNEIELENKIKKNLKKIDSTINLLDENYRYQNSIDKHFKLLENYKENKHIQNIFIAFILPSLARKGPIIVVKDIVDNLMTNDFIKEIIVLYFDEKVEVDFPCQTKRISFKNKIDFDYFDIVHSHMLRPDLYLFKNKLFGNIKKAKIISTLHQYNYINLQYDFQNKFKAYIVSKLWNLFLSKHNFIVCLSADMKKYYENQIFITNKKLNFIYNGRPIQNLESYSNKDEIFHKIPTDSIIIGTSCLLTERKGLEQVIKVLPRMSNLYFIILGNGKEEENLKNLSISLGVSERCIFLGFKTNPFEYYKHFDIFILPSRGEGFPLALLEAASMKKAIISSNLDVCLEAFSRDEISFFKLDDLDDLENKILETYQKKATFEDNVYKSFLEKYTSNIMANNYLNLYKELVSE